MAKPVQDAVQRCCKEHKRADKAQCADINPSERVGKQILSDKGIGQKEKQGACKSKNQAGFYRAFYRAADDSTSAAGVN